MVDKLDELQQQPKDPNSPESQAFLREIQRRGAEHQAKMKKMIAEWQAEDKQNEIE